MNIESVTAKGGDLHGLFPFHQKGDYEMKNFINRMANDRKMSSVIAFAAIGLATVCHIVAISAIFYNGMRKGVDKRDEFYYQEELRRYNNGR